MCVDGILALMKSAVARTFLIRVIQARVSASDVVAVEPLEIVTDAGECGIRIGAVFRTQVESSAR